MGVILALGSCGGDSGDSASQAEAGREGLPSDDAALNQALLAKLPQYPHADVYRSSVNAYYPGDGAGAAPLGHITNVDYTVPKSTDQLRLVEFYWSRLQPEWKCKEERTGAKRLPSAPPGTPESQKPGRPLPGKTLMLLQCKRGSATVSVNPDNLGATPPRYELAVDHDKRTE